MINIVPYMCPSVAKIVNPSIPLHDSYTAHQLLTVEERGVHTSIVSTRQTIRGASCRENLIYYILHQPIRICAPHKKKYNNYTGI